jgi:hypothetical protein
MPAKTPEPLFRSSVEDMTKSLSAMAAHRFKCQLASKAGFSRCRRLARTFKLRRR